MKKFLAILMALSLVVCFAACSGNNGGNDTTTTEAPTESATENVADTEKGEGVMTYAEYLEADVDAEVTIEAYIQAVAYNAEYGNACLYLADADGAYYVYRMNVTEEEAASLVKGAKLKVTGSKTEWAGEVEIAEGTAKFELEDGYYVAEAKDVTELLGTDELINDMNKAVLAKGLTVAVKGQDEEGNDLAFFYSWDNSGEEGADLYFDAVLGENTYTFTVETDECAADSDVYAAVKALKVGDVIDVEGFLYWYEGAQIHVTAVNAGENGEAADDETTEAAADETTEAAADETTEAAADETTEAAADETEAAAE